MCCRLIFCSVPASFSRLNSDSLRMSSAFKSTIYENSRIHDNQVHAYSHVYGRWETKQRITLIPKLRSNRKLFWPPFCSCLCFRCLVRCILVGSTDSFLVPGSFLFVLPVSIRVRGYFAPELSGCYAILTSPKEGETAVYGYNPALF